LEAGVLVDQQIEFCAQRFQGSTALLAHPLTLERPVQLVTSALDRVQTSSIALQRQDSHVPVALQTQVVPSALLAHTALEEVPLQSCAVRLLDPIALLEPGILEEYSVLWGSGARGVQLMQSRALPHQGHTALLDRLRLEGSFARLGQSALVGQPGCCHVTLQEGSTALRGHRLLCYARRGVTARAAERRLWNA
jgi:hypothetical protein